MNRIALSLSLVLTGAVAMGALGFHALSAQEKKEVYIPPGADKKFLVNEPLPRADEPRITIDHYTVPPDWVGGKHYHTGPVYVYVLDGSFTMDEQGKERHTYQAGELYREPIGTPMQARNLNTSAPLKLLIIQMTPKGLGCVETDSLEAALVDNCCKLPMFSCPKGHSDELSCIWTHFSGLQVARMAAIRPCLPTMFITLVRL
jgi:quercetin dioxygenase-like cupin family protein